MAKVDAVLFDLDDTLVSTSKLQIYRETRDQNGLKDNLGESSLYSPVIGILHAVKAQGIPLGLVTNSPRWYTEQVLNYHGIDLFDVIICYDDVGSDGIKPSAKGIKLALAQLQMSQSNRVIYVGDLETDYIAAYLAGVKPIAPSWAKRAPIAQIPAAILCSEQLINNLDDYDELSMIADRTAVNRAFDFPKKQLNFIPLNEKGELVPLNKEDVRLIAFGRYFSQSSTLTATLHESHQLSKDIFAKELSETYIVPQYYVDLMSRVVETLPPYVFDSETVLFDIITVIPSKKNKNPRLENMLGRIKTKSKSRSLFISDLFEFSHGAQSLKTIGGKDSRIQELQDHLDIKSKYKGTLNGKTILIIDDVITTGATFSHSFKLAEQQGAIFTFGACLAKTVSVKNDIKICTECGKLMKIRSQKSSGIHFYGCTGYFETINKCNHMEPIIVKECPTCGDGLVTKFNRVKQQRFLACLAFSKPANCKYTEQLGDI
jgi:FMN phosphatase YigB (HAD superfamily)